MKIFQNETNMKKMKRNENGSYAPLIDYFDK